MITVPSGSSYSYFSSWFLKPTCFAHFPGSQLLLYVTNIEKNLKMEVFCLLYSLYCKVQKIQILITPEPLDTKASDKQLHKSGCVRKDETIAASQRAKAGSAPFCWLFLSQCHLLKLCCTVTASRNAHTQLKMADSTELALYTEIHGSAYTQQMWVEAQCCFFVQQMFEEFGIWGWKVILAV